MVADDLLGRPRALLRAAFHEALEVDRAVLAGEEDVALPDALVAAETGVLAGRPARVAAKQVGVAPRRADSRAPRPLARRTRPHRLELGQELQDVMRRR